MNYDSHINILSYYYLLIKRRSDKGRNTRNLERSQIAMCHVDCGCGNGRILSLDDFTFIQ